MKIRVTSQYTVRTNDGLSRHIDELMRSLVQVESQHRDVSESDVSAVLKTGIVEMSTVVAADSWDTADRRSEEIFSAAIRAAGGHITDRAEDTTSDMTASIRSTEMVPA